VHCTCHQQGDTGELIFRLRANTNPQRDSIFTKGRPTSEHATNEIAIGSKLVH
jgi:hypothetical protein